MRARVSKSITGRSGVDKVGHGLGSFGGRHVGQDDAGFVRCV